MVKIYALLDNGIIFYVGQTTKSLVRYESHINAIKIRNTSAKEKRISEMLANNRTIGYKILEECEPILAKKTERKWIIKLRAQGYELCNYHYNTNRYVPKKHRHELE